MAKTAKTASEAQTRNCACGCGESVERTFKQGHDQALISKLARDLVYGDPWDGRCMGILAAADVKSDIQARIDKVSSYIAAKLSTGLAAKFENAAHRQWGLSMAKTARVEAREARKAENAAKPKRAKKDATPSVEAGDAPARPVGAVVTATATNADVDAYEAEQEKAAKQPVAARNRKRRLSSVPAAITTGATVKVKVGKRTRSGVVRGMNQAGKVTAVAVTTGGKEQTLNNTEGFEIVN